MKQNDLICLINATPYKKYGVENNIHGIIIEIYQNYAQVLFFNPSNIGEATLLNIDKKDIRPDKEILPKQILIELKKNIEKIKSKANHVFSSPKFKEYDKVELICEDKKYTKFGLHQGEIGFIMDNNMVNNCVEVDFPYLSEDSEFFGDTFSINIKDLKIVK